MNNYDDDYVDEDQDEKETEDLPVLYNPKLVTLRPFKEVTESSDDRETTEADLNHLNNYLDILDAAIPKAFSITALCSMANTACKLIETRRKVKKMPFGEPTKAGSGKVYEVLE